MDTVDASEALDRLISRRASQDRRPDPLELEPSYVESVRRFRERRRQENRARWHAHHVGMQELHALLSREHGQRAARLLEDPEQRGA